MDKGLRMEESNSNVGYAVPKFGLVGVGYKG